MPLADATTSVALLGPTNTGKTHRAVERMLEHGTGMLGLPLRLLAREIYDKVSARIGEDRVALVTGEEKRVPRRPDYWICTTEAMPLSREVDFLAVDEVQLATHDERGHVFTDRLLHARGRVESWFMGSASMRDMLERLVPAARHQAHPRLSKLSFAGATKLQRLPPRSAVVAFSLPELYRLAGLLRTLRGGAAVVLGALSPRARNAQVAMFQAGEVDYLVATDAIGMGLNLDLGHVAFASLRKFDGQHARSLADAELAQIAGRAGRYLRDGTFGTIEPSELSPDVAERIQQHRFDPIRRVRYRSSALDFSSGNDLLATLQAPPPSAHFAAVARAVDLASLKALLSDPSVADRARRGAPLQLLWQVCEIPDFRHILFEVHVALLRELYLALSDGPLEDDFMAARTNELRTIDGDVDALLSKTARLRTWAFVANRPEWVRSAEHWRQTLGALEDQLSDALHAGLVDSFVERRVKSRGTAPRRPRAQQGAGAREEGEPRDPHHPFARLSQWRARSPDAPRGVDPSATWEKLVDAPHGAFELDDAGVIHAGDLRLGRLTRGASIHLPEVRLDPLDELPAGLRSQLQRRLLAFARDTIGRFFSPLASLRSSPRPELRAIAYQLEQGLGSAARPGLLGALSEVSEEGQAQLRAGGVELGYFAVYLPTHLTRRRLLRRAMLLRTFTPEVKLPPVGRATFAPQHLSDDTWMTLGYVVMAGRAFRIDLAERTAQQLADGQDEERALACLGLLKREWKPVVEALRAGYRHRRQS